MSIVTDRRSQLVTVADAYFRGLAQKNMSQVPWHPDVVFRGPLAPGAPEPLRGSAAVRSWFEGLYPALGPVEVIEHYVGEGERSIATRADVHITQPPSVLRVIESIRRGRGRTHRRTGEPLRSATRAAACPGHDDPAGA